MQELEKSAERSPLEDLIDRARLASERMSTKNPHRVLLKDMAIALVAQARLISDLMTGRPPSQSTESRIVLP